MPAFCTSPALLRHLRTAAIVTGAIVLAAAGHEARAHFSSAHQHAHVHGVLDMAVAVEGAALSVFIQSPLDNFLGFEHAPRTSKQVAVVRNVRKRLQAGHALLSPSAAAGCRPSEEPELDSEILQATSTVASAKGFSDADEHSHAELYMELHWHCAAPAQLEALNVQALLEHFPRIHTVQVQLASDHAQAAHTLHKNHTLLPLKP